MIRHALTIDVEDWYQVENLRPAAPPRRWGEFAGRLDGNVDRLLGILDEHGVQATFFVLGLAAERHPDVVRKIVASGHELACHGWSHELVYRQTPEVFRLESRRAKALLEDLGGEAVHGYRASTFSVTKQSLWALDILAEEGFAYDSSIAPLRHDRYGIPSAERGPHLRETAKGRAIAELPIGCATFLGWRFPLGGGFLRLFPLRWTVRGIRRYENRGEGATIYLHPWELDPDQPRLAGVGRLRRFRHYVGLEKTGRKLEALLRAFTFTTARNVLRDSLGEGSSATRGS